jgi:hypothetical protein
MPPFRYRPNQAIGGTSAYLSGRAKADRQLSTHSRPSVRISKKFAAKLGAGRLRFIVA